jgi:hypothetical protein
MQGTVTRQVTASQRQFKILLPVISRASFLAGMPMNVARGHLNPNFDAIQASGNAHQKQVKK